ncbi:peptide/nickel transport system permease protein [Planifilum fulgidum]|uniref:Peptide/nickel transport system permease protein n=1 Tax=Planifilum fulgidum TaxID=201973 RepID=A0A1I2PIN8_9BACL|nr:ABC transporter permease [Planifilum fulgidum]MBO2496174.1 ABC transporter permease [Bacillota bacterium]MBO2533001.1 ABC transporter permease [Thermoactinomycetaceae bacterium]SFG13867.1 peptide/nickel transport system permease protein [Planifilum fulgidum]
MTTFIIRRLLVMIPVLILISIILFTMIQFAPGDAFTGQLDPKVDARYYDQMRKQFGLDKSPVEQYFIWAGNFVKGELGISFRHKTPVSEMISERIGNTFFLAVCALILTYALAVPLGIYSAQHPYGTVDYTLTGTAFVGLSMPSFFAGILLIYLFAFKLRWFPSSGTVTAGAGLEGIALWLDKLHHVVLPAFTLAIINIASYMRYTRASVLEEKQQDYVRTAYAKGVPAPLVLRRHVLRNALLPLVTLFGLDLGLLFSGAVITETIFSWPGLGQLLFESVINRDYPILMATTMLIAICVLVGNLVADILYGVVDPRIRYD